MLSLSLSLCIYRYCTLIDKCQCQSIMQFSLADPPSPLLVNLLGFRFHIPEVGLEGDLNKQTLAAYSMEFLAIFNICSCLY